MPSQEVIFNSIKKIFVDDYKIDENKIQINSNLYTDLDLDSIDAIDLVVKLEEATGKKLNGDDLNKIRTIADVIAAINNADK